MQVVAWKEKVREAPEPQESRRGGLARQATQRGVGAMQAAAKRAGKFGQMWGTHKGLVVAYDEAEDSFEVEVAGEIEDDPSEWRDALVTIALVDGSFQAKIFGRDNDNWEDWFTWQEEGVDWRRSSSGGKRKADEGMGKDAGKEARKEVGKEASKQAGKQKQGLEELRVEGAAGGER